MTLLAVADAQARLLAMARPVSAETVALREAAGRWASGDVTALRTQPAADLSAMDGYAIRYADLPGPFARIGESAAGHPFSGQVGPMQAVRIFTGAALPAGSDAVMVQEEVSVDGAVISLIGEGPRRIGGNVRRQGLDFRAGDIVIARGERLTPARIAVAASAGHGVLAVNRRVRIAIVATGDELVPPGATTDGLALPETNGVMLTSLLADLPVDIVDLGIIPDDLDVLTSAFRQVDADILVTTGGASVGDHDLVRPALIAAGGAIDFWRIALRPGKPMMAGTLDQTVVLGLPGNPVSAFVTAQLFLRPLIAAMAGAASPLPQHLSATLAEPLAANDHRQDYLRARVVDGHVTVSAIQDSSMLLTLARANCLLVRAPGAPPAKTGDNVEIIPLA
ncbi:MAG: molybdopterin molybdotransferase MoeA [Sphingomonas sp.]|nr:molybdopterin molybdotransferase MoeA [Sphingomonas sp.]